MNYRKASEVWAGTKQMLLNPPRGIPLPWWRTFNEYMGGLRPNEVTLLCAPTGSGKTALLSNLSAQLCVDQVSHFVAPVETGDEDFMARIMCAMEQRYLNDGSPQSPLLIDTIEEKWKQSIIDAPLYISTYDNRVEVSEMISTLKYMHQQYGCKVALLDNLNFFLNVVDSTKEKMEMDNAIHDLVIACKRHVPMHVILIVHPKKTDGGRVDSEFDIKGSSTAVQEVANVIVFNRPTEADIKDGGKTLFDREMKFCKIRKRGNFVGRTIWFTFQMGRYYEFIDEMVADSTTPTPEVDQQEMSL